MRRFEVVSPFEPSGDQGQAIDKLSEGFLRGDKFQTLKGVTGSGKTFTMAKIIERVQRPTLIITKLFLPSFSESSNHFSRIMQLNILFPIMIIISRKPMLLHGIFI